MGHLLVMLIWSLIEFAVIGALVLAVGAIVILMARKGVTLWRWQTTALFLSALWGASTLLIDYDLFPRNHPLPFVLFGMTLGLGLTLLERANVRRGRPKKQGEAP